ncbi:hypothetical protein KQX54_002370 [Cotesia glomerata]|uniref:Retrotransposon gag domain-containing protein n=1 Tax=Cotesia glomerata TaxID=32391 RepID=A0AAV7HV63_COTGL|nr:hypothetical protein KQX54_002370 [Cotesia glomerata]
MNLSNIEEIADDRPVDPPQPPVVLQEEMSSALTDSGKAKPTVVNVEVLEKSYRLCPRAGDSTIQGTQANPEDTILPGKIPSIAAVYGYQNGPSVAGYDGAFNVSSYQRRIACSNSVHSDNLHAEVLQTLAGQIDELCLENKTRQEENSANKASCSRAQNATTELGKSLSSVQVVMTTSLKHTAKIARAVSSIPEIRKKLWTEAEIQSGSQAEPQPVTQAPLGESLRRNDEQLSQLVQEIPRAAANEPAPLTTYPVPMSSPVHHSSQTDVGQVLDQRADEISEIWKELGWIGGQDASQQLTSDTGVSNLHNIYRNRSRDHENSIALEKSARARNLVFPEEEAQPKIYLQELTDFKNEQQISDKKALGLVKALFLKTHAQWLRLNSGRWTAWKHFVDAYTAYFIHPRADPEIDAKIYNKYQTAGQDAQVFIDEMQKLFMEMTTPPSEEVQIQIISQRLSKQLQAELKARQTKVTEYIGFRFAVNLAATNLKYLNKAYDENEKYYVKKKAPAPTNRVTSASEAIQVLDSDSNEVEETNFSVSYVGNTSSRQGKFPRSRSPD